MRDEGMVVIIASLQPAYSAHLRVLVRDEVFTRGLYFLQDIDIEGLGMQLQPGHPLYECICCSTQCHKVPDVQRLQDGGAQLDVGCAQIQSELELKVVVLLAWLSIPPL